MPINYINPLSNPYTPLNVEYFDRKALEQQQRHDASRANLSQSIQEVANQPYLDQEARDAYLQEQQQLFDDVIAKNAGNLSRGAQDVLGAIETAKSNPYHNLNKRQLEQSKIQTELSNKYGADFINTSTGLTDPLFTRDTEGNVVWTDPSQISGSGIQADNYSKVIEGMLADTDATKFTDQSGLVNSNNSFYLLSRIQYGEILTSQQLEQISLDPYVQAAFLANAPSAMRDTRQYGNSGLTYQQVFSDPQALGQYIYGNIQDKQRNNTSTKLQFQRNIRGIEALKLKNRKKAIDYEKVISTEPDLIANFAVTKHTTDSYKKLQDNKQILQTDISNLQATNSIIAKDFFSKLGILKFPGVADQTNGNPVSNIGAFTNSDGTLNSNLVLEKYSELTGNGPDTKQAQNFLNDMDSQFRVINANLQAEQDLKRKYDLYNARDENINNKLYTDYYNSIYDKNKEILVKLKIHNKQQFLNRIGTLTEDVDVLSKKKAGYLAGPINYTASFNESDFNDVNSIVTGATIYKNNKLKEGIEIETLSKIRFNSNKNSQTNKISNDYVKLYEGQDLNVALSNFTDQFGEPLVQEGNSLDKFLKANKDAKMTKAYNPLATMGSGGSQVSFIIEGTVGKKGDKTSLYYVSEATDNNNASYFDERFKRRIASNFNNYDFSNEQDKIDYNRDLTDYGSLKYGKEINSITDMMYSQNNYSGDISIGTAVGPKKIRLIKRTQYFGTILNVTYMLNAVNKDGSTGSELTKTNNIGDLNMLTKRAVGGTILAVDPKTKDNYNLIQKGAAVLKKINANN